MLPWSVEAKSRPSSVAKAANEPLGNESSHKLSMLCLNHSGKPSEDLSRHGSTLKRPSSRLVGKVDCTKKCRATGLDDGGNIVRQHRVVARPPLGLMEWAYGMDRSRRPRIGVLGRLSPVQPRQKRKLV